MSFWNGVWRLLGAADDSPDEETLLEHPAVEKSGARQFEDEAEVLSLPEPPEFEVHVLRPDRDGKGKATYNIKRYSDHLKNRQAVILDIGKLIKSEKTEATRIVDVLTGVTEGIDGNVWEVAENVFFFAPKHMKLKGLPVKRVEVS